MSRPYTDLELYMSRGPKVAMSAETGAKHFASNYELPITLALINRDKVATWSRVNGIQH